MYFIKNLYELQTKIKKLKNHYLKIIYVYMNSLFLKFFNEFFFRYFIFNIRTLIPNL